MQINIIDTLILSSSHTPHIHTLCGQPLHQNNGEKPPKMFQAVEQLEKA